MITLFYKYKMSNNFFNKNCPFFIEGKCKLLPCKYKYHVKCNKNVSCFNFECCYGHSISQNMRRLFKEITDKHKNPEYETAKNKCFYSINCFNPNCNKGHLVLLQAMQFINHILKESISYENANSLYNIQFKNKSPVIESLNEPIDSKLENDLLNLTEIEEEAGTSIRNDREDLKSNLLQELMTSQNNIKEMSKKIYNKDIKIQGLLNERNYLESKMYQNKDLQTMNQLYNTPAVGASGAVYGVLAAFGLYFKDAKLALIFLPIPIAAKYFIPVMIFGDLFFGMTKYSVGNIAHFAHIGGALIGFIIAYSWKKNQFKTT